MTVKQLVQYTEHINEFSVENVTAEALRLHEIEPGVSRTSDQIAIIIADAVRLDRTMRAANDNLKGVVRKEWRKADIISLIEDQLYRAADPTEQQIADMSNIANVAAQTYDWRKLADPTEDDWEHIKSAINEAAEQLSITIAI